MTGVCHHCSSNHYHHLLLQPGCSVSWNVPGHVFMGLGQILPAREMWVMAEFCYVSISCLSKWLLHWRLEEMLQYAQQACAFQWTPVLLVKQCKETNYVLVRVHTRKLSQSSCLMHSHVYSMISTLDFAGAKVGRRRGWVTGIGERMGKRKKWGDEGWNGVVGQRVQKSKWRPCLCAHKEVESSALRMDMFTAWSVHWILQGEI